MSANKITVLTAKGSLSLTKTFLAGGMVKAYDRAKYFAPFAFSVSSIQDLSELLKGLETKPSSCVIRGLFKGLPAAQAEGAVDPNSKTHFERIKKIYDDQPLNWVMLDVDNYEPSAGIDPVLNPVAAIEEYIKKVLPDFIGYTYHWQLSASAGQPSARGKLKAHLWFWLETPYDSYQLTAWAKATSPLIDVAPLRTVQVHYTANPVMADGVVDPVPVRSGLVDGFMGDEVPLVIDDLTLTRATQFQGESADYEFVNPSEKSGVVGAFHRAYPVEDVLHDLLASEFEIEAGSDRRVTWLNGGGTAGGCFITDDRMHFGSTHNTDPFDNRVVNLFDLTRHYLFGHMDEGMDAFELLDMGDRPSYQAMVNWCLKDERVMAEMDQAAAEEQAEIVNQRDRLTQLIQSAATEEALRGEVCNEIHKVYRDLEKVDVDALSATFQIKLRELDPEHRRPSIGSVRDLLRPARQTVATAMGGLGIPNWAEGYYYVTAHDQFYHYPTGTWVSSKGMDHLYNSLAGVDEEGRQIFASSLCRDLPGVPKVIRAIYMPHLGEQFTLDHKPCVNTYVPGSVPPSKAKADWTAADKEAIRRAERHFQILCNGREAVATSLLDWLSFCVRSPGIKARYSWLIWGGEGAGKTWIGRLMGSVMGGPNVKLVNLRDVLNPTFNSWAEGAAFAVIEEIRMHGHKKDAWDQLKEPLTNDKISVTKKNLDAYETPNVTNYIMFSNHHDAVPISLGSRRVAVVQVPFNGDNTKAELQTMAWQEGFDSSEDYFDELFRIIDDHGPALREWLITRQPRPDFNPNGWAPHTEERAAMAAAGIADDEEVVRMVLEEWGAMDKPAAVSPGGLRLACQFWGDEGVIISPERIASILAKIGFTKYPNQLKVEGKKLRVWHRGGTLPKDPHEANSELRRILIAGKEDDGSF